MGLKKFSNLESLESDTDKESFDKILKLLIENRKLKASCYENKTFLLIPKKDQINNNKDDLKEDFNSFKNIMINEFDLMKFSFFNEINSFKK